MEAALLTGDPMPLIVLTGFLGSGKTTLLQELLSKPEMAATLVLMNEFGDIGLDHILLQEVTENVVLLPSGCLCCAVREDLVHTLRSIFVQRLRGELPNIERIVLETSGLADPISVIHTLLTDAELLERYKLSTIVTVVDTTHCLDHLTQHEESLRQVVVADTIVMSKVDLSTTAMRSAARNAIRKLNPAANLVDKSPGETYAIEELFSEAKMEERILRLDAWSQSEEVVDDPDEHSPGSQEYYGPTRPIHHSQELTRRHVQGVTSCCLSYGAPLSWEPLMQWLGELLTQHGSHILRLKGLLNVTDIPSPVVIHGVQHVFYPAQMLSAWPSKDRTSQIVLILRDLPNDLVESSFQAFVSSLDSSRTKPHGSAHSPPESVFADF